MTRCLVSFVFFVCFAGLNPALAGSVCQREQAEDLSDLAFSQPLAKTCAAYLHPVDAQFEPLPPFLKDPAKAELRRQKGGEIFARLELDSIQGSENAAGLESWVNGLIAAGRISEVSQPVHIFELRQDSICEKLTDEKFAGMRESAKTPEILGDIEKAMTADKASCLRRGYGYSNFASREIVLGDATLKRLGHDLSRFAVLHELCHVQNPAIQSQNAEEVYCDAVAWQWSAALWAPEALPALREDFSRQIAPENENEELLGVRSQLPVCCEFSLSGKGGENGAALLRRLFPLRPLSRLGSL
jgi:hypothetical protein